MRLSLTWAGIMAMVLLAAPAVMAADDAALLKAAGAIVWLKADAGITKNEKGLVSKWADQSGKGNDAVIGTEFNPPKWVAKGPNGLPALEFNWSQVLLPALQTPEITIFTVLQQSDAFEAGRPEASYLSSREGNDAGIEMETTQKGGAIMRVFNGGHSPLGVKYPDDVETWYLASAVLAKDGCTLLVDGGKATQATRGYKPSANQKISIGFKTGASGASNFSGQIAEIIILDHAAKDDERAKIEQYLSARYKIALLTAGDDPAMATTLTDPEQKQLDAFKKLDCAVWLRADKGIKRNGEDRVTQWSDLSGKGNHAVQGGMNLPL